MTQSAPPEDDSVGRRIGITLFAVVLYIGATFIALPGIDTSHLALGTSSLLTESALSRLSVVALGITPYLSIAILLELAMIAHAPLRAKLLDERFAGHVKTWGHVAALVLAAGQAWLFARACEGLDGLVPDPGQGFRLTVMLTLVAGTAFVGFLASVITRDGIGMGLWVLFALPLVLDWARTMVAQAAFMDDVGTPMIVLSVGFVGVAAGIMTALARRDPNLVSSGQLLWPAMLTPTIAWLIYFPLVRGGFLAPSESVLGPFMGSQARPYLVALVFFVVFWLRELSLPEQQKGIARSRLLCSFALAAIIFAAGYFVGYIALPLSLDGTSAIAIIAIALALVARRSRLSLA
jgi:preprotein translocase subunit SecY